MAFSKMAGFDVTPRSPSSCTIRCSSPVVMMLRRMKSSQTDCPYSASATRGFIFEATTVPVPIGVLLRRRSRRAATFGFWVPILSVLELLLAAGIPLLDGLHLVQPADVARFLGKARAHERFHQFPGQRRSDDAGAHHEHVHIVVLHALVRRVGVVAQPGTHTR